MSTERREWAIVLLLALTCALAFQGSRGLRETTEGRYAEVAREMLETRNFLEPTLDYEPHWTKPPMTYWAIAAGVGAFGRNAWGARFFNVIAFVLTVGAVVACGSALWDRKTGACAGLVYLSSVLPAIGASVVSADALLAMWETLGVLFFVRAHKSPAVGRAVWWLRAMWLAFGLAFFTKGTPALLPLIPLALFHARSRRLRSFFDVGGVLVFVVTAFWWFALVSVRHSELLAYFLGKEVIARNVSSELSRNAEWYGALTIYAPVLLLGQGAWCYFSFRMIARRELYKPARIGELFRTRISPGLLLLLWFVIPMAIFCLSRSRLQLYILPLFAPISLATARFITLSYGSGAFRRGVRIAAVSVLAIVAVKALGGFVPARKDMAQLYGRARELADGRGKYVLFREPGLFGFQFYADGNVRRVTSSGREPWADESLSALVDEILTKADAETYVIISSPTQADTVTRALTAAKARCTEADGHGWKLIVVGGEVP